jgi:hypothetical protein
VHGAWLPDLDWIFPKWSYHYSPSNRTIYHDARNHYEVHLRQRRSRNHSQVFDASHANTVLCLPPDSIPGEELSLSSSILAFRGLQIRHIRPSSAPTPNTFAEYLRQLPCWDCRLLQAIELVDGPALIAYFLSAEPLYLVSDNGGAGEVGSFGALLASADKTFVKLSGTTEGALPGSFRAESYGCLAILRFVYHFCRFYNLAPMTCRNTFFCDNEGLIKRLKFVHGPLTPFPRHYLRSDMDLEMQIVDTIRLLEISLAYKHVHGHQDDADDEAPLTREALLNVACDQLATAALRIAQPAPNVNFFPASEVSVHIAEQTVTWKVPRVVRTLVGRCRQLASFKRRYAWTAAQFDSIDWPQFRSSTHKFCLKKRFFIIKWLNDLLPFQERMLKFGQSSLAGCPDECDCVSETNQHLLHCPAPHRLVLFLPMAQDIDTLCLVHKIVPYLRKVLLILVAPYWGEALDFNLPPEYEALVSFQQDLHVDSLFMGCLFTEWARIQLTYLKLNNYPRQKGQVASGLGAIITYLFDLTHSVWLKRNLALHGDDPTTKLLSYKHTQLLLDIQDLYDQSEVMLASDRSLFTHPYKYWLTQPTTQLLTFIQRMKVTVKVSVAQAADMGSNFRAIDSYFPPLVPAHLFDSIPGTAYIPPDQDIPLEPG